ncbi:hypothetical protein ALTER154_100219 [Alteromonas sp. 154]|nr:hypothetical protein ALTER154_100219 [Alteromonas sp. 154]
MCVKKIDSQTVASAPICTSSTKNLLHGDEEFVSGDAGYQGAESAKS